MTIKKWCNVATVTVMSLTMLSVNSSKKQDLSSQGVSPDNRLVEIVEIPENKFFVACQYHPELSSRPNRPEGLYTAFITAAVETTIVNKNQGWAISVQPLDYNSKTT